MKLKYYLDNGAYEPTRAHDADAGLDLKTPIDFTIFNNSSVTIDTGVHMEIPFGYVGFVMSKSGLHVNSDITTTGVVDSGYTGSIRVTLHRCGEDHTDRKHFNAGDKIAQIVILPIVLPELVNDPNFGETERGDNGFGSSGK